MTAKEMFKELGYKYKNKKDYICYWQKAETEIIKIEFCLDTKQVRCENNTFALAITVQELKAINKQIEELGW